MRQSLAHIAAILIGITFAAIIAASIGHARDDGHYADSLLRDWFKGLHSDIGLCCSSSDGVTITDPDIDTQGDSYLVRVCATFQENRNDWGTCQDKVWMQVPPNALVREHNRFGPAVVWPYPNGKGDTRIRCFLPGSGV
jgi:hypothetical protein